MGWGKDKTLGKLEFYLANGYMVCVMEPRKYNTGYVNLKPVYKLTEKGQEFLDAILTERT